MRRLLLFFEVLTLTMLAAFLSEPAAAQKIVPDAADDDMVLPERHGKLTLTLDPGWHTGMVRQIFFMPDGKRVVSLAMDHTIRIWDPLTGAMHKVLHPPGFGGLFAAALSTDGKRLAVASRYAKGEKLSHVIYVLALPDGRIERVLTEHPAGVHGLAFSPDGKLLASCGNTKGAQRDPTTRLWNLDKKEPARVLRKQVNTTALAFSPDGTRLACASGKGAIIDLATSKELAKFTGTHVAWSPDGKTLATSAVGKAEVKGIRLLDPDGKEIGLLPVTGGIRSLAFSPDSRSLLVTSDPATHHHRATLFNVANGKQLVEFLPHTGKEPGFNAVTGAFSLDGQFVVTGGGSGSANPTYVWYTRDGVIHKRLVAPTWIGGQGAFAAWSPDGRAVSWSKSPKASSFHLTDLRIGPRLEEGRGEVLRQGPLTLERVGAGGHMPFRIVKDGKEIAVVKLGNPWAATLLGVDRLVLGSSTGQLALFDATNGKEVRRFEGHRSAINSVAPAADGRLFLTVSADQRLRIWNPQSTAPLLTLYKHGEDWIAWTPEGYYAATPGGERLMGWTVDNGIDQMPSYHPAERFRKKLHRPDVIKLILEKGNLKDALTTANAALKKEGKVVAEGVADLDELLPPRATLQILDKTALPKLKVKASAVAAAKNQPVTALRLLVDGRPVSGANRDLKPGDKAEAEWTIDIPPGKHSLAVLARSPDSSSISDPIEIAFVKKEDLPALHVLAVGVNAYQQANLKLDFAAADAKAIADTFGKCKGDLYRAVSAKTLLDGSATRDAVLAELAALRKQVKPNDLVVMFFAGHGVQEKDNFYLLTVEANTANLAKTTLSGADLRKALGEFPCQVLLMLDACHSSAGVKSFRRAVDEATRALTDDEIGVAVLCSAMAHEKAEEAKGHGLFTRAVVEALSRTDKVPYNYRDRRQYIHHLFAFVFDEVKDASEDRQHPFLSLPWVVESFAVRQVTTASR